MTNPILQAWLSEYANIADEYVEAVRATGVEFGEPHAGAATVHDLIESLRARGALCRNADASISSRPISEACEACSSSMGSRTFTYSLKCHRSCYFCFNPNQEDYEKHLACDRDWRAEFDQLVREGRSMTHLALTGGEPLLRPAEACSFFIEARRRWPSAHLRLYTTGDQLTEELLESLVNAGMNEIRFSIKPDDPSNLHVRTLTVMRMACAYAAKLRMELDTAGCEALPEGSCSNTCPSRRNLALDVMVEMPVLPGDFEFMKGLLDEMEDMGAFGINLLEFCYPFNNWEEFAKRGFKLKNPPYPVVYNYEYAGGLAVEGSDETCLRLVDYALENNLKLSVHYCSLENKHRSQAHAQNHQAPIPAPWYVFDQGDFFLKTAKVYGCDVKPVLSFFERRAPSRNRSRLEWSYDKEDDCLLFNPRHIAKIKKSQVRNALGEKVSIAISVNVLEERREGVVVREVALERV